MDANTTFSDRKPPCIVSSTASQNGPSDSIEMDDEMTARSAISYLSIHDLVVAVTFPENDRPSEDVQLLLAHHILSIERDMAKLATKYLICGLANDMGLSGIEIGDGAF